MKELLRVLDLDNPGKCACMMLELLPLVGLGYAIIGRRPTYDIHPETGRRQFFFEKLSPLDRLIYLVGEAYFSGHLMRALKHEILHGRHRTPALPSAKERPRP